MPGKGKTKPKPASKRTSLKNELVFEQLPFDNKEAYLLARERQICEIPDKPIPVQTNSALPDAQTESKVAWFPNRFDFVDRERITPKEAPPTVNPSLLRQCQLTNIGGLFEVHRGIYQVRNCDLANITFIEGDKGVIVVDPLTSAETAKAALELYREHRKTNRLVSAVIFTHSHVDHWGGVLGVVSQERYDAGECPIYAPDGFLDHACTENITMGNVMGRRADYMYGNLLPPGEQTGVGAGLGTIDSEGTTTLLKPNRVIKKSTGTSTLGDLVIHSVVIDGLSFEFQLVPGTEAPAEMHFFIRDHRSLCTAENAVHTMHNIYSLRGAQIRDPLDWSKGIDKVIRGWVERSKVDVLFGVHHWPIWKRENILSYLEKQRDLYRYINDQTLRLANNGYTMVEIAEYLDRQKLPADLDRTFDIRGYYGSLNHNVKSAYVKRIGWFDGNPSTLHPLTPREAGQRYVKLIGRDEMMKEGYRRFEEGDYRWVAELMNHLIFSTAANEPDRDVQNLLADALEQLGYQAESGPWRNFYLTGAQELRDGVNPNRGPKPSDESVLLSLPEAVFFDYLSMVLIGTDKEVRAAKAKIHLILTGDENKPIAQYTLQLENGVINHSRGNCTQPDEKVKIRKSSLYLLVMGIVRGEIGRPAEELDKVIDVAEPDARYLTFILEHLDRFDPNFNLVTPRPPI